MANTKKGTKFIVFNFAAFSTIDELPERLRYIAELLEEEKEAFEDDIDLISSLGHAPSVEITDDNKTALAYAFQYAPAVPGEGVRKEHNGGSYINEMIEENFAGFLPGGVLELIEARDKAQELLDSGMDPHSDEFFLGYSESKINWNKYDPWSDKKLMATLIKERKENPKANRAPKAINLVLARKLIAEHEAKE